MADVDSGPTKDMIDQMLLAQSHDPHAHLRIDALQKVLSFLLVQEWRSSDMVMTCFTQADAVVDKQLGLSKSPTSDCDTGEDREAPGGGKTQQINYHLLARDLIAGAFWASAANVVHRIPPGTDMGPVFDQMAQTVALELERHYLRGYQDGVRQAQENNG
jgi:hypothetical protein